MNQSIGQDFTREIHLSLMPGFSLPRGVYQYEIQYITDTGGVISMHHISENMVGPNIKNDLQFRIGCDVRNISFKLNCHNSFPTNPLVYYNYDLRIDRLIMWNLAVRLLKAN